MYTGERNVLKKQCALFRVMIGFLRESSHLRSYQKVFKFRSMVISVAGDLVFLMIYILKHCFEYIKNDINYVNNNVVL